MFLSNHVPGRSFNSTLSYYVKFLVHSLIPTTQMCGTMPMRCIWKIFRLYICYLDDISILRNYSIKSQIKYYFNFIFDESNLLSRFKTIDILGLLTGPKVRKKTFKFVRIFVILSIKSISFNKN